MDESSDEEEEEESEDEEEEEEEEEESSEEEEEVAPKRQRVCDGGGVNAGLTIASRSTAQDTRSGRVRKVVKY